MPKIGNILLRYDSEKFTKHDIFYKQGQGFFVKNLSNEFYGLTKVPMYYSTEDTLIKEIKNACILYRELKTKSKIVILYKCIASPELRMNKIDEGNYSGLLKDVSNKIGSCSYDSMLAEIGIDFKTCLLVDDGVNKKYFKYNLNTKQSSQFEFTHVNGYQEIDYTDERYLFFTNIVEAMKKMIISLSDFFGADANLAQLMIDNNNLKSLL